MVLNLTKKKNLSDTPPMYLRFSTRPSYKFTGKLCQVCGGSGYKGRVGIYEVMKINENLRELIMKESTADVIRSKAFLLEGRSLLDYGMELVKKELTTIEEVERVCLLDEPLPEEL